MTNLQPMTWRILLVSALALFAATPSDACSCNKPPLKWSFKFSDAVFVGKVIEVQAGGERVHTMEVLESFKGPPPGDRVTVKTDGVSSCALIYRHGSTVSMSMQQQRAPLRALIDGRRGSRKVSTSQTLKECGRGPL